MPDSPPWTREWSDSTRAYTGAQIGVLALLADEYEQVVSLASEATIRKRVAQRFTMHSERVAALAREIGTIRVRAYDARLGELSRQLGGPTGVLLTEPVVLDHLATEARRVAAGIAQTHNADLARFLGQQERGLSQRELAARTRDWHQARAHWKTTQVARTESIAGRVQADADVRSRNAIVARQRATPRSAQCPLCKALVAAGWLPASDTVALPLHPACVHSWEQGDEAAQQVQGHARLWLGSWTTREETGAATPG